MQPSDPEIAPSEPTPAPPPPQPFQRPAEYYSTPVSARPLVAKWVPFGCGGAAIFFLIVLFVGGSMMADGGFSKLLDLMLGTMNGEIARMFASDVSPAQRTAFTAEMEKTRVNIREQKADIRLLQPLIESIKDATSDKLVNAAETDQLMREMQKVNAEAAKPRPKKTP